MGIVKNHTQAKGYCRPDLLPENAGFRNTPSYFLRFSLSGGETLKKKLRQLLLSEDGDASYISIFVYVLIVAILLAFILNVFHIISSKQEMDHMADQLVKQIQLSGGTNSDTDSLFTFLAGEINEVEGLSYQVTGPSNTGRIQIGTPFYVTVTGRCYLGGFWKFNLVPINIRAQGAGVSEHYWK